MWYTKTASVQCLFSLCPDSRRTTVVKGEQAVSMMLGGGSAQAGRWEESNGWECLSMHMSLGELTTEDTDKCTLPSPMLLYCDYGYFIPKIIIVCHAYDLTCTAIKSFNKFKSLDVLLTGSRSFGNRPLTCESRHLLLLSLILRCFITPAAELELIYVT